MGRKSAMMSAIVLLVLVSLLSAFLLLSAEEVKSDALGARTEASQQVGLAQEHAAVNVRASLVVVEEEEEERTDYELPAYVVQAYETGHLPQADRSQRLSYAKCSESLAGTPPLRTLLRDRRGWTEKTDLMRQVLAAKTFRDLSSVLRTWCSGRKVISLSSCIARALSSTDSPFGDMRLFYCHPSEPLTQLLGAFQSEGLQWPERILVYDGGAQEFGMGEKTSLLVRRLPSLSEEQQRRAFQYVPRSYLAPIGCAGSKEDSQWNLWLEDFFDGDENEMAKHRREGPGDYRVSDVEVWREKQSIDKGKNLWVSKPGLSALSEETSYFSMTKGGIRLHGGMGVKVFRDPRQWTAITDAEGAAEECFTQYRVLQKYVERPMLWYGRKADIRLHTLTISADPPVHYAYFGQLPVRKSRFPYTEESLSDLGAFVTNQALSVAEGGGDVTRLWEELCSYLQRQHPEVEDIRRMLERRLMDMVAAVLPTNSRLTHDLKGISLQAWDVALDEDLHPWLMEINNSFHVHNTRMDDFILPMVGQALDLGFRDDVRGPSPPLRVQDFHLVPL